MADYPPKKNIDTRDDPETCLTFGVGVLGPGQTMGATLSRLVPDVHAAKLGKEGKTVIIYGKITYRDAFGDLQWTNFYLPYAVSSAGVPRITTWEEGNDAS